MNLKPFKYGGYDGVIDFTDYVVAEQFEAAHERVLAILAKANNEETSSAKVYKTMFVALMDLFESTLGEGASNQLLGPSTSFNAAMAAYLALREYYNAQDTAVAQDWTKAAQKVKSRTRAGEQSGIAMLPA